MSTADQLDSALETFPHTPILSVPSPVIHLQRIGEITKHPNLWMKNDAATGFLTGGTKVRALEYLIGNAKSRSASTLRTFGYVDSNFVLATALYCTFFGIKTDLVLMKNSKAKATEIKHSLNCLARLGTNTRLVEQWVGVLSSLFSTYYYPRHRGQTFAVPIGGASPIGCLGYVAAAGELVKQIRQGALPCPAQVVVPVGSGGLLAGLAAGLSVLSGGPLDLLGVRVAGNSNLTSIAWLASRTRRLFMKSLRERAGSSHAVPPAVNVQRYNTTPASISNSVVSSTIDLVKSAEGIQLDYKYAGPAMSVFLDTAMKASDKSRPLLFWNTCNGGSIEDSIYRVVRKVHAAQTSPSQNSDYIRPCNTAHTADTPPPCF